MLIGHLPAGYLFTRALQKSLRWHRGLPAGLIGAVIPDVDMVWFYLVDGGLYHHHVYWPHKPFVWLCALTAILAVHAVAGRRPSAGVILFFAALLLHLALDTIAGSIQWLWPFSDRVVRLVDIPATHSHWVLSFLHHWTFKVEIAVWVAAIIAVATETARRTVTAKRRR